ncbi:hypothetical protein VIGAN_07203800, partial [Vigna angularis var. angularis]
MIKAHNHNSGLPIAISHSFASSSTAPPYPCHPILPLFPFQPPPPHDLLVLRLRRHRASIAHHRTLRVRKGRRRCDGERKWLLASVWETEEEEKIPREQEEDDVVFGLGHDCATVHTPSFIVLTPPFVLFLFGLYFAHPQYVNLTLVYLLCLSEPAFILFYYLYPQIHYTHL